MEDDPFYDPDDLSHNLFATGYELDPGALGIPEPDAPRGTEDPEERLRLVDEDTVGRGVGLPVPDRDDLLEARANELAAARRALGRPADRRESPEGVRRVLEPEPDLERAATTHPSRRGADNAGADPDADELERVTEYLLRQRVTKVSSTSKPGFAGCKFKVDKVRMVVLPSGDVQLTMQVPYETRWEAMKLMDAGGYLLEASVRLAKGLGK